MNRRTFITATGAMLAGASLRSAAQDASRTHRACIIGDTADGGYGHDMHRAFALQPSVEVVALAAVAACRVRPVRGRGCAHAATACVTADIQRDSSSTVVQRAPPTTKVRGRMPARPVSIHR